MSRKKTKRRITQGGMRHLGSYTQGRYPDIVLQQPQMFLFDLAAYMRAVRSAKGIDISRRVELYDMYESTELDLHLSGVIAKRLRGVTRIPIQFLRDGKRDDRVNETLDAPWFRELRKDIILAQFWGFSLMQFFREEDGAIGYELINRKHYDPINRKLLKYQGDIDGIDIDTFDNMLFVGKPRDLGILAVLLVAVLYKRGSIADWAKFCNIWGIPIREYTYSAGDEETRMQLAIDARTQGANAVYIHPRESELNIIQAGDKSGSSDLYKTFTSYWDEQMSIRVLGNTLTTQSQGTGTYAMAKVHQDGEDEMQMDDCDYILDVLNYQLKPILIALGLPLEGGKFAYAKEERIDITQQMDIVLKANSMGLPIGDDYVYKLTGIEKPENYDEVVAQRQAEREALQDQLNPPEEIAPANDERKPSEEPTNAVRKGMRERLSRFFGVAPKQDGAELDF